MNREETAQYTEEVLRELVSKVVLTMDEEEVVRFSEDFYAYLGFWTEAMPREPDDSLEDYRGKVLMMSYVEYCGEVTKEELDRIMPVLVAYVEVIAKKDLEEWSMLTRLRRV